MKKVINIILGIPCLLFTLVSCEIDNYPGPNASFQGSIKDMVTGEPVETDLLNGSVIRAFELGFPSPVAQNWVIKNTGEFYNDLVFSARYDFEFINCNFYPFKVESFEIKGGINRHDFEVTPYIRIRDVNITHHPGEKKVVATFRLEGGKPEVRVSSVRLYAFTDIHVGDPVRFATTGSGFQNSFSPAKTIDDTVYTLSIDLDQNANFFKYSRNYYFRVGALANVPNVGTVRHNYAPIVKITI